MCQYKFEVRKKNIKATIAIDGVYVQRESYSGGIFNGDLYYDFFYVVFTRRQKKQKNDILMVYFYIYQRL